MSEPQSDPSSTHLEPYRKALDRFGAGFRATLWASREAQHLRFDVMTGMADFEDRRIIDVGCGLGDFAAHLLDRRIRYRSFIGIDAFSEMIDQARQRELANARFEAIDLVAKPDRLADFPADFVCISGTLNTMDDETARGLIRSCFEHAEEAVIFNFLSDRPHDRWKGRDLTPARRFDTVAWIDWALSLSSRVVFAQDYLDGHDATICIRREPVGADA